jgi:hypothetical protein
MPDHLLAVLAAIYCDGLTERQTAERLGITCHHLRKQRNRALAILPRA